MATLKLSGYLATAQTALTTEMNSITDNTWSALGSEIDNSTNKYAYADLDLVLGSLTPSGTDAGIEVYIVPIGTDGTTYPDWTGSGTAEAPENSHYFVAFLPLKASTSAKRVMSSSQSGIVLPQGKFKFGIRNRANVTLPSSGNTLYWRPKSYDAV